MVTRTTTTRPNTASLFLSKRRHASRHNDVPRTNSPASSGRTSASATAISGLILLSGSIMLLISHAWIEVRVSNVNQQIHHQQHYRDKRDNADDQDRKSVV